MAERTLAGHAMVDGPGGMACNTCGRSWLYILDRREQWVVGEAGIRCGNAGLRSSDIDEMNIYLDHIFRSLAS